MNRYNAIIPNDVVNGRGVCTSFFVQGCPHHCPGCFNEETWDFKGGQEYTSHTKWEIIEAIGANGLQRNFSILGGEPLALENIEMVEDVLGTVRQAYPEIEITLWTGYTFEELKERPSDIQSKILNQINILVDGRFIEDEKDLSLQLRGSKNQHIWKKINNEWEQIE
jgi:anaerobic ribonucleoside-triphosphate reductase activating protein